MAAWILMGSMGAAVRFAGAAPLPRDDAAYVYYADNAAAEKVLSDFCANFGIRLSLEPGRLRKLNGRMKGATATEFLNKLASTLGLNWFYYAGTLYMSPVSDWETRTFSASRDVIADLKQVLTDLGLYDVRFALAALPEQGVFLMSGPRAYLDLVESTMKPLGRLTVGYEIAVFRLKHASAEDRTVVVRDKQTSIPGVTTLLKALVGKPRGAADGRTRLMNDTEKSVANAMSMLGSSPSPRLPDMDEARPLTPFSADSTRGVTIEADTRLNAVVVKGPPEAMPLYERLIGALDVPAGLIEIEAMTVDINKSFLNELGIDWTAALNRNLSLGFGDPSAQNANAVALNYRPEAMTVVANHAASLVAKIRMLETSGNARVIGKPSVLTMDNHIALIDLSQTFYVKLEGERVASLAPVTTGVMLKVTPRLIEGGASGRDAPEIQLSIDIEDGTLIDRTGLDLPVVQRSTISTEAKIRVNQSLLIGGYDTETDSENSQRVPFFSNIPALGALFRNRQFEKQQRKRLFLITPRIVNISNRETVDSEAPPDGEPARKIVQDMHMGEVPGITRNKVQREERVIPGLEWMDVPERLPLQLQMSPALKGWNGGGSAIDK